MQSSRIRDASLMRRSASLVIACASPLLGGSVPRAGAYRARSASLIPLPDALPRRLLKGARPASARPFSSDAGPASAAAATPSYGESKERHGTATVHLKASESGSPAKAVGEAAPPYDSKEGHGRLTGYLGAVQSKDPRNVVRQFTENGKVVTLKGVFQGAEDIEGFYRNGVMSAQRFRPEAGPQYLDEEGHAAVEIGLDMDGVVTHVGDIFTFGKDGRIESLEVFSGKGYAPARKADCKSGAPADAASDGFAALVRGVKLNPRDPVERTFADLWSALESGNPEAVGRLITRDASLVTPSGETLNGDSIARFLDDLCPPKKVALTFGRVLRKPHGIAAEVEMDIGGARRRVLCFCDLDEKWRISRLAIYAGAADAPPAK